MWNEPVESGPRLVAVLSVVAVGFSAAAYPFIGWWSVLLGVAFAALLAALIRLPD